MSSKAKILKNDDRRVSPQVKRAGDEGKRLREAIRRTEAKAESARQAAKLSRSDAFQLLEYQIEWVTFVDAPFFPFG